MLRFLLFGEIMKQLSNKVLPERANHFENRIDEASERIESAENGFMTVIKVTIKLLTGVNLSDLL